MHQCNVVLTILIFCILPCLGRLLNPPLVLGLMGLSVSVRKNSDKYATLVSSSANFLPTVSRKFESYSGIEDTMIMQNIVHLHLVHYIGEI